MSKHLYALRLSAASGALALGLISGHAALAQSATAAGESALPPVVVNSQKPRRAAPVAARHVRAAPAATARAPQSRPVQNFVENPRGPIQGYVANRSMVGTKTNTAINQTPQSVSVIGAEQIRDQKPAKLDDLLRYTPGILGGFFGTDTRADWFMIRGFQANADSFFLDGLQLFSTSYATWKIPPVDIERVEVLRGPSAVLYGGSSPAGLINIVSKMPPAEPIRYIETGVNNYGNRYVSFDVGGPIATAPGNGQLLYRVVGQAKAGDTQTDYVKDDSYSIAPSLTWKPDADTSFTVLASATKTETNSSNFLPYVGTVVDAPYGRIRTSLFTGEPSNDKWTREQEMIGYQFEHNVSDSVTVRQNARYAHLDSTVSGLYAFGYATTAAAGDLMRGNFYAHNVADQANLDNQLEYRFDTGILSHTALFGLDLKYYSLDDYQGFEMSNSLNVVNPVYTPSAQFSGTPYVDANFTQKQLGAYLQDQIRLGRITLVLSGRNDWVKTDNDNHIGASLSRDDSKFSGRAGLIYNFDNGLAPYVSYATSFNPIVGTNAVLSQLYLPETGKQTEVGVKFQPNGFDGHFGVALFDLKRQNVLTTNPDNALQSIQTGEVTSRGLELEAVANLMPGFKVTGSFTTYNIFVSKNLDSSLIGTVPTNTPRQLTSAWGDYTFQNGALAGFGFGGGVRYVGASFADTANTLSVPAYVLGDAAIHYQWDNWRLALNVTNITDEIYVGTCQTTTACFYGDRRRAVASLGYKW